MATLNGHGVDSHDFETLTAYDGALADFAEGLKRLHLEFGAPPASQIASASAEPKLTVADIDEAFSGTFLPSLDVVMEFVRVLTGAPGLYEGVAPLLAAQPERSGEWKDRWREVNSRQRDAQDALRRIRYATKDIVAAAVAEAESVRGQAHEHAMEVRHRAAVEAERAIDHARRTAAAVQQQAAELWSSVETEFESLPTRTCGGSPEGLHSAGERIRGLVRTADDMLSDAEAKARLIIEESRAHRIWPPEAGGASALRQLQDAAEDLARRRLPEIVALLSQPDHPGMDLAAESLGTFSEPEVDQVARAFDEVYREAVRLAAEQALLRGSVNAMVASLARRSQGLIQRQLSLISELESREADPDQLSSLFRLDHLVTRMRRNGENLLVLAGEEPGRRWTRPVPLVDVLRAAASEVEQYERIEVTSVPSAEVTGRIVNDFVHLLAELLENATSFSSPQTKVRVTGHALPDGRVLIEIHDTGIGLSPEDLADVNERLANPPTVDVAVSRRMGLFVVGRLSLRHGIRIQLRPSDSGGTTALVMLPVDCVALRLSGVRPGGPSGR
ncbi:ATP-binding protein [Streptomyces sp. NBC_00433]